MTTRFLSVFGKPGGVAMANEVGDTLIACGITFKWDGYHWVAKIAGVELILKDPGDKKNAQWFCTVCMPEAALEHAHHKRLDVAIKRALEKSERFCKVASAGVWSAQVLTRMAKGNKYGRKKKTKVAT